MPESYDIIIVGGGTAGLVLAARLSENADLQVVVIEAGEDQTANPQALTPGMWPLLTNSAADWAFRTAPQVRPRITYVSITDKCRSTLEARSFPFRRAMRWAARARQTASSSHRRPSPTSRLGRSSATSAGAGRRSTRPPGEPSPCTGQMGASKGTARSSSPFRIRRASGPESGQTASEVSGSACAMPFPATSLARSLSSSLLTQ